MKEERFDKYLIGSVIDLILGILRVASLVFAVLFAGLTIGYFVIIGIKGADMDSSMVVSIMRLLGGFAESDTLSLISINGLDKVIIAGVMYGGIMTVSCSIIFAVVCRAQEVFRNIIEGKTFTKNNINLINETIPLTFIYIFFQPILLFVVSSATGVYGISDLNYYGIAMVLIECVLKYILEQGADELKDARKNEKIIGDCLAKAEENEMNALNKENKINQLKEENKELKAKIEELENAPKEKKAVKRNYYKKPAKKIVKKTTTK